MTASGEKQDGLRRFSGYGLVLLLGTMLALEGCAARPRPVSSQQVGVWAAPPGSMGALLSATPGPYDFSGIQSVTVNGQKLDPTSGLYALSSTFETELAQVTADGNPIVGRALIVLPDHDRLRVLAMQATKRPGGGIVEFTAEEQRLGLHLLADTVNRSGLFSSVGLIEQNDTAAPDGLGSDYLIWFQVRSLTATNAGPWVGRWQMKRAGMAAADSVGVDPGTPAGAPRLMSFVKSIRTAAAGRSGGAITANADGSRRVASTGTGIVIDAQGHILTNNHVIAGCPDLRIVDTTANSNSAALVAGDAADDLALLKTERRWSAWARFRDSRGLRPGEPVVVTGFPLTGLVSPEMAVTTGSLTALAGLRGDPSRLQFSAPVEPGNSGGPVLDESGRVIGVASSMLNGLLVAGATGGAVPQNVNFAIKTSIVDTFLAANHIAPNDGAGGQVLGPAAVGDLARKFTVKVECWR